MMQCEVYLRQYQRTHPWKDSITRQVLILKLLSLFSDVRARIKISQNNSLKEINLSCSVKDVKTRGKTFTLVKWMSIRQKWEENDNQKVNKPSEQSIAVDSAELAEFSIYVFHWLWQFWINRLVECAQWDLKRTETFFDSKTQTVLSSSKALEKLTSKNKS